MEYLYHSEDQECANAKFAPGQRVLATALPVAPGNAHLPLASINHDK
jgi:hypothetical protein